MSPPSALKTLTSLQEARQVEIEKTRTRLANKPLDSLSRSIVQSRIDAIKEIWAEARRSHAEIIAREDSEADPYVTQDGFGRLQDTYEEALDSVLVLLQQIEVVEEPTVVMAGADVTVSDVRAGTSVARLPKIPLPQFSGKYEDWDSFCDLFTALVHDAPLVSDATKLQYLKLCLTGSAADLIREVTTTSANYVSTWQALKARYHNPRLVINKLLSAFLEIPYLKKESAVELRSFADEAQRIVRALSNLKLPVDHWDVWFIFILSERLDPDSRKAWESELSDRDRQALGEGSVSEKWTSYPKFSVFTEFLERRAQTLSMIAPERRPDKRTAPPSKLAQPPRKIFHASTSHSSQSAKCSLCSGPHPLTKCHNFRVKNPADRRLEVRRLKLCFNCFGQHLAKVCPAAGRCWTCQGKHHTLIHVQDQRPSRNPQQSRIGKNDPPGSKPSSKPPVVSLHAARLPSLSRRVLLATARVKVVGPTDRSTYARALLDQGSEVSFISEAIVQLLGLPKRRTRVPLSGLGASAAGTAHSITAIKIQSPVEASFQVETEVLVLPRLTTLLPSCDLIERVDLREFSELQLADPGFWRSEKVDLILGADLYGQLLRSGVKRIGSSELVAQDTVLGWVVSGPLQADTPGRAADSAADTPQSVLHCALDTELDRSLQRFWTLEEVSTAKSGLKPEDETSEKLFQEIHGRDSQGRYVARLPLKSNLPDQSAETRRMALGSLSRMHSRFIRDPFLFQSYCEFMEVYEKLGHMERVPPSELQRSDAWYLPHHAVVVQTPIKRKLRVVFDGSRRTKDGCFLNDFLLTGPPLQNDLALTLLNWRKYRFAFTADIVKMFRQIQVRPEDQDFQRIVWAPNAESEPVDYRLTTVTYGTSCAPYLAIRTLAQLVEDEGNRFPLGAQCLRSETYVDDTFAGADDLSMAMQKRDELVGILGSAGIRLDKWAANHADLLPGTIQGTSTKHIDVDESIKTLGVHWNPAQDEFRFEVADIGSLSAADTKRYILSNISRLFDPLGWLAPVTVIPKILMQDMWILKCDWDTSLPADIRERWSKYCKSLFALPSLSIDRWIGSTVGGSLQIHGFSDASTRAFAAVVYLRIEDTEGNSRVSLLSAKSKVAPVKTVSIPNLELCGAALLTKLILHVTELAFLKNLPIFAWSDSQIVLTWLRKHPCHWKTFVANRVSLIQTELPSARWSHVPTKENPADLATRGVQPEELVDSALWWQGPPWLSMPPANWPQPAEPSRVHLATRPTEPEILTRFSSLTGLLRFVAYCKRPVDRLRTQKAIENPPRKQFLLVAELSEARLVVIRLAQSHAFPTEIALLKAGKTLPKRNRLTKLNPFLCSNGILRVGGRLTHSNLTFDRKHPPILSHDSALALLFVRYAHHYCLHGGITLTSSILMQQVWILGRKRLVKSVVYKCVTCQRAKPHSAQQLMGDLPAARITRSRAFSECGLDYAGPVLIRMSKGRGYKTGKAYVVLFICLATRAIHLELVSDLTAATFISAYRRMVGRRGICRNLHSDNATNFHGADRELQAMFSQASEFYSSVASLLANDGTHWTFIPPSTPHYGGLWEAGVKSVKHHLRRVVGDHTLTFEELSTVLVEIEACLNSRPIGALSADVDDLQALTPSHFLNEGVSSLLPEPDLPELPENRLTRFQLLQRIRNNFWKRWASEYIQHMQEREKWKEPNENFAVGRLVLVKDDRYPASKWPLGRVIEVHPGPDGLVRVVTVKTATSSFRRHVARICPLYLESY